MSVEYFGGGRLFGSLHHPQRLRGHTTAVLLCNPFGEEASRAHRTFRVLATLLERAGYAALRFDYSESADATIDAWLADIGAAAARLGVAAGGARLAIVGLRLGATLAALAAARGLVRPRHLLMWDPIVDGAAYLRDLTAQHRSYMRFEMGPRFRDRLRTRADGTPLEALGAPIGDPLAAQLAAIDLAAGAPSAEQVTLLTTRVTPETQRLQARLPAAARWIQINESAAWNTDAALNSMTVPMDIVRALVARIEETSR